MFQLIRPLRTTNAYSHVDTMFRDLIRQMDKLESVSLSVCLSSVCLTSLSSRQQTLRITSGCFVK